MGFTMKKYIKPMIAVCYVDTQGICPVVKFNLEQVMQQKMLAVKATPPN